MAKLWRPEPQEIAARQLKSWGVFFRALGRQGIAVIETSVEHGEWVVPYYGYIKGVEHAYYQVIGKGYGPTLLLALLDGFQQLSSSPWPRFQPSLNARLAMLDMLLETR